MGTHAAVVAVQGHLRRFPWYVKIDIRHYFETLDHARLFGCLQRRFKGAELLVLLWRIIGGFHSTPGKGLPIGSLTSQHFANYYLDSLDRLILERLPARAQVRYMDDIIWWCDSREVARDTLEWVRDHVRGLDLMVKDDALINRSSHGVSFCGYRITPGQLRLSRRRRQRYQRLRLERERDYRQGLIDALELQRAYAAIHAITLPADALGWRRGNLLRHRPVDL